MAHIAQQGGIRPLYNQLFESSADAIVITGSAGAIAQINAHGEQIFGYAREELIGQKIEILIPDRDRESYAGARAECLAAPRLRPTASRLELSGRRKDGTEFPLEIMINSVKTDEGLVVLSVMRDITEQKKLLEDLHVTEQRFRLLVESAQDYAIFLLDTEGHVKTWNSGAERLKGYRDNEIIGRPYSTFYSPEDIAAGKPAEALHIAATQGRFEAETWRVCKDGSRFWANVILTALHDNQGKLIGFAKITRDFTERRLADEKLRRSEQQMRSLFDFSPDAIVVSDLEGKIAEVNPRVQQLFGYERAELIGRSIDVLVPERFRQSHPQHRIAYSHAPRTRPMGIGLELYGLRKDGSEFPVDITLAPVDGPDGRKVLSVVRDLSERRQYEEALNRAEQEKQYLEQELGLTHQFDEIIGESMALKAVLKEVEKVADTAATVLILGETGTGKDLIARAIHRLSPRRERTLVKLNCAAIPTGLLESELFGHEKGAFTGAISQKIGRLELAHKGTLFLDEVGDLPPEIQPKLLRALQEKEFERLGSTRTISVDVRLVAATNRDLGKMVAERQFRSDLYYRLRVFPISIPALRERREDIPLLVRYFVQKYASEMNRNIQTIPPEVMHILTRWDWPGNIRELENFIERAVILTTGSVLRPPLAELAISEEARVDNPTLETANRDHILRVLRETSGAIGGPNGAAARLGLRRTTLNSKLKKLGIERKDYL